MTTITILATATAPASPSIIRLKTNGPLEPINTASYLTKKNDQGTLCASDMAVVHNFVFRGYNSIYQQAPYVKKRDHPEFVQYALAWWQMIEAHHDGEEKHLFPLIESKINRKNFFGVAVEQHALFHDGLDKYKRYLDSCAVDPDSFNPQNLLAIMDSFGPALESHLNEEPQLLLKLAEFEDQGHDFMAIFSEHGKEIMGRLSAWSVLPFLWVNHDTEFEDGLWAQWPPAPKPVVWTLRNVMSRWNMRWWRFGSCDLQGRPQQYLALREEYRRAPE